MNIYRWNNETDGPLTETALIDKLEKMDYRCTRYTYPRGTLFPDQQYNMDKIDAVLKGQMKFSMGSETVLLNPGDYVLIPRETQYTAEVIGDDSVVSIDAVRTS